MAEKYTRKPNTECVVCKKKIYRRPFELKNNNGRVYCSSLCYGFVSRKEKPCVICGKLILSGLNKKTCSGGCANTQRQGIKYTHKRLKDKVKNYQSLKIRLMEKRGKMCEICGYKRFEILQVHHIDRKRSNNQLDNLKLICPNCHYEEHLLKKSWLHRI